MNAKKKGKRKDPLDQLIKAATPEVLGKLIKELASDRPEIRRECFEFLKDRVTLAPDEDSASVAEALFALWWELEPDLSELDEYGGGDYDLDDHVCDLLYELSKGLQENKIPREYRQEHEYIHCFAKSFHARENPWKSPFSDAKELMLNLYLELKAKGMAPVRLQKELREFIRDNRELLGEIDRYKFVDEEGIYTGSESVHNPHPGGYEYNISHPETGKAMRKPVNGYRFPEKTMREQYVKKARLIYGPDEKRIVKIKLYLDEYKDSLRSVISLDGRLGAYSLRALFGESETLFSNPKPVQLIQRFLGFIGEDATVLDYFAGSGTTVHAILNIERLTGKKLHYVLVEMADYVDTVLIPRIKKVVYSKDWKNGKPVSREGISHMFKYTHLESYEDALHNLASDGTMARIKSKEDAYKRAKGENEYRIRYLVNLPLEASDTMLNLARLEHPFNYNLEVLTDDGPRAQAVDLVETFNFLYGLSVRRLVTWKNEKDGRDYRVVKATDRDRRKRILVVWRDMTDLEPKRERKFLEGMLKEEDEFDEKLINGDTATPGFKSLDSLFKRLMEAD
jgi:adenine-specific DNA-methyltransferase